MNAVVEHGTPLVDDPDRVGAVSQLGVDETSFLAANRHHATVYATGLVDLTEHIVIDMVEGKAATCDDGPPTPTLAGWRGSRWWLPIWPSRSVPACLRTSITPAVSPTRSTSCGSPTLRRSGPPPSPERDVGSPRPQA